MGGLVKKKKSQDLPCPAQLQEVVQGLVFQPLLNYRPHFGGTNEEIIR